MRKQKFNTKLFFGFGTIFFFICIIAILAIALIKEISKDSDVLYHHPLAVSNSVRDINIYIGAIQREMLLIQLTNSQEQIMASEKTIDTYQENV